jgi:hypothetical protein
MLDLVDIFIKAEIPGLSKENISIQVTDCQRLVDRLGAYPTLTFATRRPPRSRDRRGKPSTQLRFEEEFACRTLA